MAINGFSTCDRSVIKSYTVPGTSQVIPVRAEIAPLLIGFAARFHKECEPLVQGWNWGYACRLVRGIAAVSYHAGGLAIDLNAPRHPLGKANTFNPTQRAWIRAVAPQYGLRWGGTFSRPDDMHFEVILPRTQALALVRKVQAASVSPPVPKPPAPVLEDKMLYIAQNANGADVWVGDGVSRRWINSVQTLGDLKWVAQKGGQKVVELGKIANLNAIGTPVGPLPGK